MANANDLGINRALFNQLETKQHLKAFYDAVLEDTGSEEVAAYVVEGYLKEGSIGLENATILDARGIGPPDAEAGQARVVGFDAQGNVTVRTFSYEKPDSDMIFDIFMGGDDALDPQKIVFDHKDQKGKSGPMYTMIEEGNGRYTDPNTAVPYTNARWLELIEINTANKTTTFAGPGNNGADDYVLRPANPGNAGTRFRTMQSLSVQERAQAIGFMVNGTSNGAPPPSFFWQPSNQTPAARTHGRANLWSNTDNPGGVYRRMPPFRNDLFGNQQNHRLSNYLYIPGIGALEADPTVIRRLMQLNNCVPQTGQGNCP